MTDVVDGWLIPNVPASSAAARLKTSVGPGDFVIPVVFPDYRVRLPFQTGDRGAMRAGIGHAGVVIIKRRERRRRLLRVGAV